MWHTQPPTRWAALDPSRVALIWERDAPGEAETVTYAQLLDMVAVHPLTFPRSAA